jgi:hypothetical protein
VVGAVYCHTAVKGIAWQRLQHVVRVAAVDPHVACGGEGEAAAAEQRLLVLKNTTLSVRRKQDAVGGGG